MALLAWALPGGWEQAVAQFCADISEGASAQGSLRNHSLVGRTELDSFPPSFPPSLLPPE